jgi:hypothetical protein
MSRQQYKSKLERYSRWHRHVYGKSINIERRLLDDMTKYGLVDSWSEAFFLGTTQEMCRKRLERHRRLGHVIRSKNSRGRYVYKLSEEFK